MKHLPGEKETDNKFKVLFEQEQRDRIKWQEECAKLKAALRRCKCIYCGIEVPFKEQDKLANHIMSCEKSPMVQMVKGMESRVTDYMDLMNDEFTRITTLTKDPEIIGICQRAMMVILQKEPVIKQRDDAQRERDQLKAQLEEAKAALQGRLGDGESDVVFACREYIAAEDELPDEFDLDDYRLSKAVKSLLTQRDQLKAQLEQTFKGEPIGDLVTGLLIEERDQALACCAEMRALLSKSHWVDWSERIGISHWVIDNVGNKEMMHALSTSCGRGWFNADQLTPTIELLDWVIDGLRKNSLDAKAITEERDRLTALKEGKP